MFTSGAAGTIGDSLVSQSGTVVTINGTASAAAINISTGGSTTISTGIGVVNMSSGNSAKNVVWIPINYAGTTYYVPGFTTNNP